MKSIRAHCSNAALLMHICHTCFLIGDRRAFTRARVEVICKIRIDSKVSTRTNPVVARTHGAEHKIKSCHTLPQVRPSSDRLTDPIHIHAQVDRSLHRLQAPLLPLHQRLRPHRNDVDFASTFVFQVIILRRVFCMSMNINASFNILCKFGYIHRRLHPPW